MVLGRSGRFRYLKLFERTAFYQTATVLIKAQVRVFCCHHTWISGLATSKEIFLLSSLERSATASSLFCTSMPLIFKEKTIPWSVFTGAPGCCCAELHGNVWLDGSTHTFPASCREMLGKCGGLDMWCYSIPPAWHLQSLIRRAGSGILGFGTLGALPTRTWIIRSPSRSRPSFAAMLLGSICKVRELWVLCRLGSSVFASPYFLSGVF